MASSSETESSARGGALRRERKRRRGGWLRAVGLALAATASLGCTPFKEYVDNGFKVGPNYRRPPAPVAPQWIDAADKRVRSATEDMSRWWAVFNDPVLDGLVQTSYRQNLTVREAGFRVLQARAQYGIARGGLFPQQQTADGGFTQSQLSRAAANRGFIPDSTYPNWDVGFSLAWELDFWGRFRRSIASADDQLDASVEQYDDVLVTLVGDVATAYVQLRTVQQQTAYVTANVALQRETLSVAKARFEGGDATDLDVEQATSVLLQTESQIPQLEIQARQLANRLCILLGMPVEDLAPRLGPGPIPTAPAEVAAGAPADLLARRPDVRRAERLAAAQAEQIGIAMAAYYPAISISGTIGYSAAQLPNLFAGDAVEGMVGPSFQWNVLNYGRLVNNVRFQDAKFQELVATYQQTVLQANEEAENALVQFLKAQRQSELLAGSVKAAEKAVQVAMVQYQSGTVDFNRVAVLEQNLVQQQNLLASARSDVALGLIQLYRALGGGWEIRFDRGPPASFEGAPAALPAAPPDLAPPVVPPPPKP